MPEPERAGMVDMHGLSVAYGAVEQTLEGLQPECRAQHAEAHGIDVCGAFGHHHQVGPVHPLGFLAQPSCGQQTVVGNHAVVIYQQDVEPRFHPAVLEGVVEQDDLHVTGGLVGAEMPDAPAAVGIHGHVYVGELLLHLPRLVAYLLHGRVGCGQHVPATLTLVSPA